MWIYVHTKICAQMLGVALFTTIKCQSTDNKMWYIHTMGYYWAIKRSEVLTHVWNLKTYANWKKPVLTDHTLCEYIHTACPEQRTPQKQDRKGCPGLRCKFVGWWLEGMRLLLGVIRYSKIRSWWWLHNLVSMLKTAVVHTLNEWIACCENYI